MSKRPVRPDPHPGPRVRWAKKGVTNDAPDAIFLSSSYGLAPDDWQEPILFDWLARRRDGKFCHGRCGLAVPRQNGKNGAIEIRELFGMVVLGEAILHTAHEVKTARKAFKRLKHFFGESNNDPKAKYPELNALVAEVRNTNGQEAIVLKDVWLVDGKRVRSTGRPAVEAEFVAKGGSVEFVARSNGSGRGYTVDVLILDEAQHLADDELEAIRSAVSSAPLGNPQVIYTGTPPNRDKGEAGEVWLRIRAMSGKDKRLAWTEYGAPDGPLPDIDDIDLLFETNPALELQHKNGAYGLQMDTVSDERGELSPEGYARERYGWWGNPDQKHGGVIDMTTWRGLKVAAPKPTKVQVVVDVSPDLTSTTVATASVAPDGRTLVLVDRSVGTGDGLSTIKNLVDDLDVVEVALTPAAGIFATKLTKAGIEHKVLTNADVGRGCTAFQSWVKNRTIAHVGQQDLDDAAKHAKTRMLSGTQQWIFDEATSPIVAASTAAQRWSLNTAKPSGPPPSPQRTAAAPPRRANDIAHVSF